MENYKINRPMIKIGYSANKKYSGKIKVQGYYNKLENFDSMDLMNLESEVRNLLGKIEAARRFKASEKQFDFKLSDDEKGELYILIKDGCILNAIKRIKEMRGLGLRDAKVYIDKMISEI